MLMNIMILATVPTHVNIVVHYSGSVNDINYYFFYIKKNSLNLTHAVKMGKFNYL